MRVRLFSLAIGVVAALALTATAMATPGGAAGKTSAKKTTAITLAPRDTTAWSAVPTSDWPVVGGNYGQTRFSGLTQVNSTNVTSLKEAWHIKLGSGTGTAYRGEGVPIVYQGTMYHATGNDDVYAIDAANGTVLWTYKSSMSPALTNICCGWDNRGLAIGAGRVYMAQLDGKVVALDQQTGGVLWTAWNGRFQDGYTMTMAPLYWKGLVIVGVSGSEQGARGSVTAYDAEDGHRVWRFYNVPTPGDIGAGTWANNNEWQTGGATVWNTPALDVRDNLITYTTANPDPWSGRGPGDNLFSAAMVGINALTGDYRWHFQMVHHDLWDYDCPSPTMQFDATINGKLREVAAEACKTGWLYEVDANNGNTDVTLIDEKAVPQSAWNNSAATQPIPAGDAFAEQCPQTSDYPATAADGKPFIYGCIWTPYDDQQFVATAPGTAGGLTQAASSYSPSTGMVYVGISQNSRQSEKAIPNASSLYRNGRSFTGRQSSAAAASFLTTGDLTALNVSTNKIAWKQHFTPDATKMGTTNVTPAGQPGNISTAGNLVFTAIPEGVAWAFAAYNATTGALLWTSPTAAGIEAQSPMTYSVGGTQYVAVYAGGRNTTTAPFTHGDDLYAYKLG